MATAAHYSQTLPSSSKRPYSGGWMPQRRADLRRCLHNPWRSVATLRALLPQGVRLRCPGGRWGHRWMRFGVPAGQ